MRNCSSCERARGWRKTNFYTKKPFFVSETFFFVLKWETKFLNRKRRKIAKRNFFFLHLSADIEVFFFFFKYYFSRGPVDVKRDRKRALRNEIFRLTLLNDGERVDGKFDVIIMYICWEIEFCSNSQERHEIKLKFAKRYFQKFELDLSNFLSKAIIVCVNSSHGVTM